jgi:hypothetical protein
MKNSLRFLSICILSIFFVGSATGYTNPNVPTDYNWGISSGDSLIFKINEKAENDEFNESLDYDRTFYEKIIIGDMEDQTEKFEVKYTVYNTTTTDPDFESMDDWGSEKDYTSILNKSVDGLISQDFYALPRDVGMNDIMVDGFIQMIGESDFISENDFSAFNIKYWIGTETPSGSSSTQTEGSDVYVLKACMELNVGPYNLGLNLTMNVVLTGKLDSSTHIFKQIQMQSTSVLTQYNVSDSNATLSSVTMTLNSNRLLEKQIKSEDSNGPFKNGFPIAIFASISLFSIFIVMKKYRKY